MLRLKIFILLNLILFGVISAAEPIFIPVKIDGPIHDPANHTYWYGPFSECASVLDVDGDGDLDIASGRNWYEAPDWIKHTDYRDGAKTNGPETDDNSEFAMDVNFDGRMDIVSSGWMFMRGAYWYENPGKKGVVWKSALIHKAENLEGVIPGDIDGDGDDDILCNHWSLVEGQGVTWLEHIDREPWFIEHVIGTEADVHGNGLGDINMDGRMDIVTPSGWYEQPRRATDKSWTFHAEYQFQPPDGGRRASASHPILVYDVNKDGLNDIIIGNSHAYGLAWLEQEIDSAGNRTFQSHWIETEFSQFHTMELGDLNGDGEPDLVTGKRLFAHHGDDIGAFEPLYAFWYDIQKGEFERHILSFNNLPKYQDAYSNNPPPNYVVSVGMKLNIADMDKNGRNDVVIAGKGGLYVFYNIGEPPTPRNAYQLPPEKTYPSWVEWMRRTSIPRRQGNVTPPVPQTDSEGFITLFDGSNLDNWNMGPDKSWVVEDGVITLKRGEFDGQEHNSDYLWTKDMYGDFILELELRVPERGANSGIFFRTSDLKDPVYTGIEMQVSNSYGRDALNRRSTAGAIYEFMAPSKNPIKKPGEWNQCRIMCEDNKILVWLNGEQIIDMDVNQWTKPNRNQDGSKNKFSTPLKDFAREGYIGLQDHGRPVWYRNIKIRPLQ